MPTEGGLDSENATFWNELCGSSLARRIGATGRTLQDLRRFDIAYFAMYPYLPGYLLSRFDGQRVLEIGLGFGSLGQLIVQRGAEYVGVDVASAPVEMMQYRHSAAGPLRRCHALRTSVLALPFASQSFDWVVSIGCLHHTGHLRAAVNEVHRVLRRGGRAVVMVYNRHSLRQVVLRVSGSVGILTLGRSRQDAERSIRARYDVDGGGNAAPHTDFLSAKEARAAFSEFREVRIDRRNLSSGRLPIPRRALLASRVDRFVGLDLYISATR